MVEIDKCVRVLPAVARVHCPIRCMRRDNCTDNAVTDGKVRVCHLQSAAIAANCYCSTVLKVATMKLSKVDTKKLDTLLRLETPSPKECST